MAEMLVGCFSFWSLTISCIAQITHAVERMDTLELLECALSLFQRLPNRKLIVVTDRSVTNDCEFNQIS